MSHKLNQKYLKLLGKSKPRSESALESFQDRAIIIDPSDYEFKKSHMDDLIAKTKDRLNLEVELSLETGSDHSALIDETLNNAQEGLAIVGGEGLDAELSPAHETALEAIVIANGTRPSIKIDDVVADMPINWSEWAESFGEFKDQILDVAKSVGRIDKSGSHYGTGIAVAPGIIMTNRHVLEQIALENIDNQWSFHNESSINFGGASYPINAETEVIFAPPPAIAGQVNFSKKDIALLRCNIPEDEFPKSLKFRRSSSELMTGRFVYVLGFPARPAPGYESFGTLKKLFNLEFSVKRVSPGEIDAAVGDLEDDVHGTVFQHDCTTLGGNSGSAVVDFDETGSKLFGLHFSGAKRSGNFAHSISEFRNDFEDLGLIFE